MDEKTLKAAEISKAITDKGKRALWIPIKGGIRIFEVDQKEVKEHDCRDCKAFQQCKHIFQSGSVAKCIHWNELAALLGETPI